ncbi:MAG TPA: hypothetical protein PK765_01105 [bacterium]|nr:hypothetical protein [bacterium]
MLAKQLSGMRRSEVADLIDNELPSGTLESFGVSREEFLSAFPE